ncbi:hypothetical protein CSB11_01815 [Candidatus Campbellbacteria bacterium]|nr:MAG: hypothetical protein CSB11_01815 [Candidatus Campbellbacteria bacterium]
MLLTNFKIKNGGYLQGKSREYVYVDEKYALFKVDPHDPSLHKEKYAAYGDWDFWEHSGGIITNGVMHKIGSGEIEFFPDTNCYHNILIYRIKEEDFGKIVENNKYSRVKYQVQLGEYVYFFIVFSLSDHIDFCIYDEKGKLVDALSKRYKKPQKRKI